MGTNAEKHARQKERRARVDEARDEMDRKARQRRVATIVGGALAAVVLVVVIVSLTGSKKDSTKSDGAAAGSSTTTEAPSTSAPKSSALPTPPKGLTLKDPTPCPPEKGSAKRVQKFAGAPPTCIDTSKQYVAIFETTKGPFTAELDAKKAPVTVNNFIVLARYHFYDGVPFHRVVPGFVIQGGDGDGEPWGNNDLGYTIADELPTSVNEYKDMSLAMANAGPNTNGSQFFVVLPGGGPTLGKPAYSLFGQVVAGQSVVGAIGKLGGADQKPTEAVVIKKVTIKEQAPGSDVPQTLPKQ